MEDKKFIIGAAVLSVLAMIPFYGLFISGEIDEHTKSRDARKATVKNTEWERNMNDEQDAVFAEDNAIYQREKMEKQQAADEKQRLAEEAAQRSANGGKGTKQKEKRKKTKRNK